MMSEKTERFSASDVEVGVWISIDDAEGEFVMGTVGGAVTALNALTSERDEAVRERDELRTAMRELQRRIPHVNGAQTANLTRWHRIITDSLATDKAAQE